MMQALAGSSSQKWRHAEQTFTNLQARHYIAQNIKFKNEIM